MVPNRLSLSSRRPACQLCATADTAASAEEDTKKTPIHLLAGFLGSGKTTTLQHLLENTEGVKIGVVVNDVASVNIDAKLVNSNSDLSAVASGGIVELQNGCACCSLAGEFVDSVESLLSSQQDLDAVVVELSGVADPTAVKNTWRDAVRNGHAVTNKAALKNVVTLVDSCTFGEDYFTWDIVKDRKGWLENTDNIEVIEQSDMAGDCGGNLKVTELLAEQVEAADLVVVNKVDLAESDQVTVCTSMVSALNDKAKVIETSMGKMSPTGILKDYSDNNNMQDEEVEASSGHSHSHDHDCEDPDCSDASHSHSHDHGCEDPECTDSSHSHSHDHACEDPGCTDSSHSHSHEHSASCDDPDCTDDSHSHSHEHSDACNDPECTDSSHSHSHEHGAACNDPDCTDTSHSHSHDHQSATSTDDLGISNFVYKAVRPMHAMKLQELLFDWPIPIKNVLDLETLSTDSDSKKDSAKEADNNAQQENSPFKGVLRSKGFCWFAPTSWDGILADPWRHDTAMYWSHAGKHMGIQQAGRWWGSLGDQTKAEMKTFFADNPAEYDRILREDFVTDEWGDRRQEIVFIGVDLDQKKITDALDNCLLSEEEMDDYRTKLAELQAAIIEANAAAVEEAKQASE